jgi:hypothetical protein
MPVHQPRYSKEEFAQRGDLIYQTQIRPQVEARLSRLTLKLEPLRLMHGK